MHRATHSLLPLAALAFALASGCGPKPNPAEPAQPAASAAPASPTASADAAGEKRYKLKGTIVQVDKAQKHLVIDHEDIPGFMSAMTMPYPVVDDATLARVGPGDQITADVVTAADGSNIHLDNVVVVKKGSGKPASQLTPQQQSVPVPDFALVNQDGKTIGLRQYAGKTVLVTFIYTRCPLPDYCPLMSHNFAQIEKQLAKTPALYAKTQLLSISFDAKNDTPAALRNYAKAFLPADRKSSFTHWQFATVTPSDLREVTKFFNIFYDDQNGQVTHSLQTAIISPDGNLYRTYSGNEWKPNDVLADLTAAAPGVPDSPLKASLNP